MKNKIVRKLRKSGIILWKNETRLWVREMGFYVGGMVEVDGLTSNTCLLCIHVLFLSYTCQFCTPVLINHIVIIYTVLVWYLVVSCRQMSRHIRKQCTTYNSLGFLRRSQVPIYFIVSRIRLKWNGSLKNISTLSSLSFKELFILSEIQVLYGLHFAGLYRYTQRHWIKYLREFGGRRK